MVLFLLTIRNILAVMLVFCLVLPYLLIWKRNRTIASEAVYTPVA